MSNPENKLFSKGHHISSYGADVVSRTIADYLHNTTKGFNENFSFERDVYSSFENECMSADVMKRQPFFIYFKKGDNGSRYLYGNDFSDNAEMAIFGDCNLQAYTQNGGVLQEA